MLSRGNCEAYLDRTLAASFGWGLTCSPASLGRLYSAELHSARQQESFPELGSRQSRWLHYSGDVAE